MLVDLFLVVASSGDARCISSNIDDVVPGFASEDGKRGVSWSSCVLITSRIGRVSYDTTNSGDARTVESKLNAVDSDSADSCSFGVSACSFSLLTIFDNDDNDTPPGSWALNPVGTRFSSPSIICLMSSSTCRGRRERESLKS